MVSPESLCYDMAPPKAVCLRRLTVQSGEPQHEVDATVHLLVQVTWSRP